MQRDVNPKKFLGQHFLIDDNISKKIVEAINFKIDHSSLDISL